MNIRLKILITMFLLFFKIEAENLSAQISATEKEKKTEWTFVSMPDFLNVDTAFPQPGWEQALNFVLTAIKEENPEFMLVAGDLLMGRWRDDAKIKQYAQIYYPAWISRMKAYGLKFYTGIGDHELGDNPWPPERAKLVPAFKKAFRDYLQMPLNGPDQMKGTAFYFAHKNTLFISVDVFEEGKGDQGDIITSVSGKQLVWLDKILTAHRNADHIVVMGHTPVLGPVRMENSSGLMLENGRQSEFWQCMAANKVDLYLCGEVHAITCTERDGVQQIAHGGLFGYNAKVNYLVVRVSADKMELELKELDIVNQGKKLWQVGNNRPKEFVNITDDIKKRGYIKVGSMLLEKKDGKKIFKDKIGYFDENNNPKP